MKKILLIVFLGIAFSTLIFAQDVRYEAYLKKNHLVVPSDTLFMDSIDLLNSCKIKYASDDSLVYANLITKDTIIQVSEAELGSTMRLLGKVYADFDGCFFWGSEVDHDIYGNIIYKSNPYFRIDKLFVYIDANIKHSVLILADANCEGGCPKIIFVFNAKTGKFTTYLLKKEIPQGQLKDLRFVGIIQFVSIIGNTITLRNVVTNEVYKGTKVKNKSEINSGMSN